MCTIEGRRKSAKNVFLHFHNEEEAYFGIKKLNLGKYNYAVKLYGKENPDFLFKVSQDTSERDFVESYNAVSF